jgi:hypothetical protein
MNVVAAGMHHADFGAEFVRGPGPAGVRGARLFGDRQRIEIRSKQDGGAGAVAEDADDAMSTDAGGHFGAGLAQLLGDARGGFFLAIG